MAENNQALQNYLSELKTSVEAKTSAENTVETKTNQEPSDIKAEALRLLKVMNQMLKDYHYGDNFKSTTERKSITGIESATDKESATKTVKNKVSSESSLIKLEASKKLNSDSKSATISGLSQKLQDYLCLYNSSGVLFTPDHSINEVINDHTPFMVVLHGHLANKDIVEYAEELLNCSEIDLTFVGSQQKKGFSVLTKILYTGTFFTSQYDSQENVDRCCQILQKVLVRCPESIQHIYAEIPNNDQSFLNDCAMAGRLSAIKILHKHGANMDFVDTDGTSLLFSAAQNGYFELVKYLIEAKVNLDSKLNLDFKEITYVYTVLHLIAYNSCVPRKDIPLVVAMLLSAGAKYNIKNESNKTPYEITQMDPNDFPEHVQRDPANEPEDALEPGMVKPSYIRGILREMLKCIDNFFVAIKEKNMKHVKEYLEAGLPIHCRNAEGETPLHVACKLDSSEMAKLLIQYKAKITVKDDNGHTPIDIAANHMPKNLPVLMNLVQKIVDKQTLKMKENLCVSESNYTRFPRNLMFKIWEYCEEIPQFTSTNKGKSYFLRALDKSLGSKSIHADAEAAKHKSLNLKSQVKI